MKTEDPAMLDQHMESTLARLPEWQVPDDFAKRLAAAAARQAVAPLAVPASPSWIEVLPLALASIGMAAVLAWIVPWSQLSASALVWTCVSAMSVAGAALTLRVLRTP